MSHPSKPFYTLCHALCAAALIMGMAAANAAIPTDALVTAAEADRYHACMALTERDPQKAFDEALAWSDTGGGAAARHCAAAALLALGLPRDAALRLEALAQDFAGGVQQRQQLLGDAAHAWLGAGDFERAEAVLDAALALGIAPSELLVDRAVVRATRDNMTGALEDLDAALAADPQNAEAWTLRASAKRRTGNEQGALADAQRALAIAPDDPEALLERGLIYAQAGNAQAARADWMTVLRTAPASPAAIAAQSHLERLDVQPDK